MYELTPQIRAAQRRVERLRRELQIAEADLERLRMRKRAMEHRARTRGSS